MQMTNELHILGIGHYHPKEVIDNRFIESLDVGTTAEWIIDKIGIEQRLSCLPLDYIRATRNQDPAEAVKVAIETPTDMGVKAARMALTRAGLVPDDIGLVLCDCCTPLHMYPSESARIAQALGIAAVSYDVFTACPAFALHMRYLENFNSEDLPEYVLCVCTNALTQCVNYQDRTDGAIWGDGAAAWIVSPRKTGKLEVLESTFMADPTRCDAVVVDRHKFFHQDGRAVRDFSVRQTVRLLKDMETRFGIDWSRDVFVGHQANATMLEQICNNREIGPGNHWHNVRMVGNQAGAGAPAVISEHWDELTPGKKIVVAVVGAGLSWGSVLLEAQTPA
jgi:3-oxoacyl-[acyl-carrier-protein] synthase-3